jgi:hypothetical protein
LNFRGASVATLLILLSVLTAVFTFGRLVLVFHGIDAEPETRVLWSLSFALMVMFWVYIDRQSRSLKLPFEFDTFVIFFWPVALPYYLYRSRGWKGFLVAALIVGMYITPSVTARIGQITLTR